MQGVGRMTTSNAREGAAFERMLAQMLAEKGFWTLQISRNAGGQQPADIITVFGDYHALIDCKVISGSDGFSFSRVEDNQRSAMGLFHGVTGECGWFAIRQGDVIRMLSLTTIEELEANGKKSLNFAEIVDCGWCLSFNRWLDRARSLSGRGRGYHR